MSVDCITDEWDLEDHIRIEELSYESGTAQPTAYTSELAIRVCIKIATDPRPMAKIIEDNPWFPSEHLLYGWRLASPVFGRNFNAAKKAQAQLLIDQIICIIDDPANCEPEILNWAKSRVGTRQWLASKLLPKIYGDQKQIDELKSQNDQRDEEIRVLRAELDEKNKREY